MYRNKVRSGEKDYMTEDQFNRYTDKIAKLEEPYYKELIVKSVANDIAIWLKHRQNKMDLENFFHEGLECYYLVEEDIKEVLPILKEFLIKDYGIKIIQESPLIVETTMPLNEVFVKGGTYEK